ncbi:glycosyltransferase [Tsuneonella mangrovi]|uniref:glycosyltransferase n=1 Tax=Tsuneonella mangrovi TaxID=1982042 RepID=UPI000BA1E3D9|nr:glycosyltransferase family 2 protein [Tsuneonella mangrovi]
MDGCSIIMASRNGADTLPLALGALAAIIRPDCEFEYLLVDNASDDATPHLLQAFADQHGGEVLAEPVPGKSHALNRALERARGELLVFLDDDAMPAPDWLRAYVAAAERDPGIAVFAGGVTPHWLATPPEWLASLAAEGRACGCTAGGRPAAPIDPIDVKGGNFAMRRSALGSLRFETGKVNFGSGGTSTGGEDTRFVSALAERGNAISFVPDATVGHVIAPDEMRLGHQLARFARIGRGAALVEGQTLPEAALAALKVPAFAVRAAIRFVLADRTGAADALTRAAMNYGRLSQGLTKRAR